MRNRIIATAAAALAAGTITPLFLAGPAQAAAPHCSSGYFCAFNNINYSGLLLKSSAGRGARADVANDLVSSGSNNTNNLWVGVTRRTGLPDQTVFRFGPKTEVGYVGAGANDRIDHFNVA